MKGSVKCQRVSMAPQWRSAFIVEGLDCFGWPLDQTTASLSDFI